MQTGNIGVTTENIFPVIKKFLYSEQEIFIREIVSNAVDASVKLVAVANKGDYSEATNDLNVLVELDKKAKTITVKDRGIGMTAEEIDKYINQIAFSGVTDFIDKYKDDAAAIIGHFGLGFYSSFMVSDTVEIITKSYKPNSVTQHWVCDGSPNYTIEDAETERDTCGTTIIMHISDDCAEYLDMTKLKTILQKYCRFMSIPVALHDSTEPDEPVDASVGETDNTEETTEAHVSNHIDITDITPIWTKKPTELTDEDYLDFYKKMYPGNDDPLFWIHLNVDYPFTLTGVLYFPQVKRTVDMSHDKVHLFCNQVFVTDSVIGIVPDFLTLLHGVIDSPNIPLNVSRSYLQSDSEVRKISGYIERKVADALVDKCKNDREKYEAAWDSISVFVKYGILSTEEFLAKTYKCILFKDTNGKYFTPDEYYESIKETQTDKNKNIVVLYTNNKEVQSTYISFAVDKGYSILEFAHELDSPLIDRLEHFNPEKPGTEPEPDGLNVRFVRVDSNSVDKLIEKDEEPVEPLNEADSKMLTTLFYAVVPTLNNGNISFAAQALDENTLPTFIVIGEWNRRIKEISKFQANTNWMMQIADSYVIIINTSHKLVKQLLDTCKEVNGGILESITNKITDMRSQIDTLTKERDAAAASDASTGETTTSTFDDDIKKLNDDINTEEGKYNIVLKDYAQKTPLIKELIDIALLQNGMLTGDSLAEFIKRSINMFNIDND